MINIGAFVVILLRTQENLTTKSCIFYYKEGAVACLPLTWQMGRNNKALRAAKKTKTNKENKIKTNTMKKTILTTAIIFTTVAAIFAQTPTPTATVNLNVKLNAIQSITASATTVDLVYKTIEDYNTGVKSDQANHLTVYSTGGFIVKVSSSVKDLAANRGSQTIESSGITVTASGGATTLSPKYTSVNLGTTSTELISTAMGGTSEKFNIEYKAAGSNAYVNKFFKGTGASTDATIYTTVVTYSIEAK